MGIHVPCSTKSMQLLTKHRSGFTDKHTSAREEELSSVITCTGRAASALCTNCSTSASVDAQGLGVWAVVLPRRPHWLPIFPKTTCLQLLPPITSPVRVWPKSYVSVLYTVKVTAVCRDETCSENGAETSVKWDSPPFYWEISDSRALLSAEGTRCARFHLLQVNYDLETSHFFSRGACFAEYFVIFYCITTINTRGSQLFDMTEHTSVGEE